MLASIISAAAFALSTTYSTVEHSQQASCVSINLEESTALTLAPLKCAQIINNTSEPIAFTLLKKGQLLDIKNNERTVDVHEWRHGIEVIYVAAGTNVTLTNKSFAPSALKIELLPAQSIKRLNPLLSTNSALTNYKAIINAASYLNQYYSTIEITFYQIWIALVAQQPKLAEQLAQSLANSKLSKSQQARLAHMQGSIAKAKGLNELSARYYQQCQELFSNSNEAASGYCGLQQATALNGLKRPAEALVITQTAIELLSQHEQSVFAASAAANISISKKHLRQIEEADYWGHRALELHRQTGMKQGEINALNNLGSLHRDYGSPDLAVEYYQLALALLEGTSFGMQEGTVNYGLAKTYTNLGEFQLAAPLAGKAAQIFERHGYLSRLTITQQLLGEIYVALDAPKLAASALATVMTDSEQRNHQEQAIAAKLTLHKINPLSNAQLEKLATQLEILNPKSRHLANAYFLLGERYLSRQQHIKASDAFTKASQHVSSKNFFGLGLTISQRRLSLIDDPQQRLQRTESLLLEALPKLWQIKSPTLRLSLLQKHRPLLDSAIEDSLELGLIDKALLLDEAGRALLFKYNQRISQRRLNAAQIELLNSLNQVATFAPSDEHARLRTLTEEHLINERIALYESPVPLGSLMYQDDLDRLKSQLSPDDMIVVYREMNDSILQWRVTREETELNRLSMNSAHTAKQLNLEDINHKNLWIIADQLARKLSFASLPYGQNQYLIDHHNIALIPAISLAWHTETSHPEHISVVGDAQYHSDSHQFSALPESKFELDSIAQTATEEGIAITQLRGHNASLENLINLTASDITHIAAHSQASINSLLHSGLILSVANEQHQPIDHFLSTTHIRQMHSQADLTVLSSCAAADGFSRERSETYSIGRAFLAAGSNHVVAANEEVEDKAAAWFFNVYYKHLLHDKQTPAQALANTQRDLRNSKRWSAPKYWAHWVIEQTQLD